MYKQIKTLSSVEKKKSQSILTWSPEIESALFGNRFKSIAEQMGVQLQHSAFSVNVKERLDFSCALLDPKGRLLANAPHIPVHLGSLGISARLILKSIPSKKGISSFVITRFMVVLIYQTSPS